MIPKISDNWLQAFGSPCHLMISEPPGASESVLKLAEQELHRLEEKFSFSSRNSVINQINDAAGTGVFTALDAESKSLFSYVAALWNQSNHLFDPSTRVLRDCFHANGQLRATGQQLRGMLKLVGWAAVEISDEGVRLPMDGMVIDLDNCVRPYAVDSVRRLLLRNKVGHAFIEMDQDIASIGKQSDGANWLVGMRLPKGPRTAISRLKLNDRGFAIRGNFEHRVQLGGENFSRALSPVDGQPLPGLLSVAVVADTCLTACSAASIARLKTEQAGIKWLQKLELPWIAIDRELNCIGPLAPP